jgi:hypothetical protein
MSPRTAAGLLLLAVACLPHHGLAAPRATNGDAAWSRAPGLAHQGPGPTELRISLAADHLETGPAAWRLLRREVLGALPGWPVDVDPLGAVGLELGSPNRLSVRPLRGDLARGGRGIRTYFEAELRLPGIGLLTGRCDFEGRERWQGSGLKLGRGRWRHLVGLIGARRAVPVALRCGALIECILDGRRATTAIVQRLLDEAPRYCGTVHFRARTTGDHQLVLESPPGNAGILLPGALAWLADRIARPDVRGHPPSSTAGGYECWLTLARAGVGLTRQVAARQLGLLGDPRARPHLERLLTTRDETRLAAMEALANLGSVESVPRILAAASPRIEHSEPVAEAALRTLWRNASAAQRHRLAVSLPTGRVAALRRDQAARLAARTPEPAANPTAAAAAAAALLVLVLAAMIGLVLWQRRRALATQPQRPRPIGPTAPTSPRSSPAGP